MCSQDLKGARAHLRSAHSPFLSGSTADMKAFGIAQTILCASTVASALFAPTPTTPHEGHEHVARRRTEKRWYHDDDHPVRRLFVRQDGGNTAEYGTPGAFPLSPLPPPLLIPRRMGARIPYRHPYPRSDPAGLARRAQGRSGRGQDPGLPAHHRPERQPRLPRGQRPQRPRDLLIVLQVPRGRHALGRARGQVRRRL